MIAERTGQTFLPANQTFAIFEAGIRTGGAVAVRTSFSFTDPLDWLQNPGNFRAPSISVSDVVLSNESSSPRIDASLKNQSLQSVGTVEAVAIVYDAQDNAVNTSRTIVQNLAPGAISPITFTWPAPFSSPIVRKEIVLRVYPQGVGF